jgi:hypothetical protein
LIGLLLVLGTAIACSSAARSRVTLHYAPNGNFGAQGQFLPREAGFNLADVNSLAQLQSLPDGVKGLVWVGQCAGADANFLQAVKPYIGNPKLFGYFLMDDPDPRKLSGAALRAAYCPADNLRAESDWIHQHAPQARTFVVLMNLASRLDPAFGDAYKVENSHVDLFGIDPYPCRTELGGCDVAMIDRYVIAAEASGIPRDRMVPIYQAFGGGDWRNEAGGKYNMPTISQMHEMLANWGRLIESPEFDFAYSWGSQRSDKALEDSRELKEAFLSRNTHAIFNSQ